MELYHNHPHDPREEIVQPEDIRLQTRLTMRNHKEILDWVGLDWSNVVKLTRFQKRMDESKQIEEVLRSYFNDSWPPMTIYEVNGLSSPQARLEIEMWVAPAGDPRRGRLAPSSSEATTNDNGTASPHQSKLKGLHAIFPRPEVTDRSAFAPGIEISPELDLLILSGVSAYPPDVDPWNPGRSRCRRTRRNAASWRPRTSIDCSRPRAPRGNTSCST